MKKGKSITLLTVLTLLIAFLTVMTFARFPMGTKNFNSVLGAIQTDYDLSGGTAYTLTTTKDNVNVIEDEDVDELVDTLKYRMNALGYQTYSVKAFKVADDYEVRIEAKGDINDYGEEDTSTLAQDVAVVAAFGELKFYGDTEKSPTGEDKRILKDVDVIKSAKYAGSYTSTSGDTSYQVAIEFTSEGYDALMDLIESNSNYYVTIMLGETELLSGSSTISKDYFQNRTLGITTSSEAGAKQAALQISSGGLKYEFEISEGVTVTAPLGENAETWAVIAIAATLVIALIALTVLYKGYGVIAAFTAWTFTLIYLLMLIAVLNVKVSLGGVIGILAATVLTLDGLMITAKRIKEEANNGKMIKAAVKAGFRRSFKPIINSAVVSAIVAIAVLIFAKGSFACFGVTLGIGAVVSAFSTLVLSRIFTSLVLSANGYKYGFLGLKRDAVAE